MGTWGMKGRPQGALCEGRNPSSRPGVEERDTTSLDYQERSRNKAKLAMPSRGLTARIGPRAGSTAPLRRSLSNKSAIIVINPPALTACQALL